MDFFESQLTRMLDQKMLYHSERTSVLAENVANADTPGFKAKDVKAPDFNKMLRQAQRLNMAQTSPLHLAATTMLSPSLAVVLQEQTSELNPNSNNVSTEEQVQKVAVNASDYQLALNLHQNIDKMFKTAIGAPKGG